MLKMMMKRLYHINLIASMKETSLRCLMEGPRMTLFKAKLWKWEVCSLIQIFSNKIDSTPVRGDCDEEGSVKETVTRIMAASLNGRSIEPS